MTDRAAPYRHASILDDDFDDTDEYAESLVQSIKRGDGVPVMAQQLVTRLPGCQDLRHTKVGGN